MQADPYYVCHGSPLRVFTCVATTSDPQQTCLTTEPSDSSVLQVNPVWKIHQVMGRDPVKVAPVLYCVDDSRATYSGNLNLNIKSWFYDGSNLEFKNGQICSYDKKALSMYTSGFIYAYNTLTGLTDDQLAVTNGNVMNTAYSQASILSTKKATIWENFDDQVQTSPNKDVLLSSGVLDSNTET
jgi:hypothetical protein